jgi:hypothetical protein
VLRGLMIAKELKLTVDAGYDLVLLYGAFASLLIYVNQVGLPGSAPAAA